MAVMHMIWIKFRDELAEEQIEAHLSAIRGLRGKVPDVLDLSVGRNFTDRCQGYTHGLAITLTDKAALAAYATHPYHVEVAQALRRDSTGIMALDYEF